MQSPPPTSEPLQFLELTQETLYDYWDFIKRGLGAVLSRVRTADWKAEEIFASFRIGGCCICIVQRGPRNLGFAVYFRQNRPFSRKPDLFLWVAWFLPLRERQPTDNIEEAIFAGLRYLKQVGITNFKANRVMWMSSRRGFERKYGFKPQVMTFWLDN